MRHSNVTTVTVQKEADIPLHREAEEHTLRVFLLNNMKSRIAKVVNDKNERTKTRSSKDCQVGRTNVQELVGQGRADGRVTTRSDRARIRSNAKKKKKKKKKRSTTAS
jgi:hypothetical protein